LSFLIFLNLININLEKIFFTNFYIKNYFFELNWIIEFLPELILITFILYSLVSIFNDEKKIILQFYRWFILYFIIFVILLIKIIYFN
jgi:hypothetical protein